MNLFDEHQAFLYDHRFFQNRNDGDLPFSPNTRRLGNYLADGPPLNVQRLFLDGRPRQIIDGLHDSLYADLAGGGFLLFQPQLFTGEGNDQFFLV